MSDAKTNRMKQATNNCQWEIQLSPNTSIAIQNRLYELGLWRAHLYAPTKIDQSQLAIRSHGGPLGSVVPPRKWEEASKHWRSSLQTLPMNATCHYLQSRYYQAECGRHSDVCVRNCVQVLICGEAAQATFLNLSGGGEVQRGGGVPSSQTIESGRQRGKAPSALGLKEVATNVAQHSSLFFLRQQGVRWGSCYVLSSA